MNQNEEATSRAATANGIARASLADLTYYRSNLEDGEPGARFQEKSSQARAGADHGLPQDKMVHKSKHSGASVVTFFTGLFQTILGIATLGASISFSYVLSNTQQPSPTDTNFTTQQVQLFLAVSWLLFLLALAFASLGSTLLTFFKTPWQKDWDGLQGSTRQLRVQVYAVGASAIMGTLIIAAFCLLCLVVVAYTPIVGWIALGFTGLFAIIIYIAIINQLPWIKNEAQAIRHRAV
ncbi:hypothetical protein DV736_g1683, partial [Chaetothyriales sp. CBS 134916]